MAQSRTCIQIELTRIGWTDIPRSVDTYPVLKMDITSYVYRIRIGAACSARAGQGKFYRIITG